MKTRLVLPALLMTAVFGVVGCGDTTGTGDPASDSTWEKSRQAQDDPSAVKSGDDIAGNCVMDVGSGAKICGTQAIDYCVGGLAPSEAEYACSVIVADALKSKR